MSDIYRMSTFVKLSLMKRDSANLLTVSINDWIQGQSVDEDALFSEVYELLKNIAHQQLNKFSNSDLNTTVLVNEFYLELQNKNRIRFQDRKHFFAVAAKLIRRFLLVEARNKKSLKRGGDNQQVTLSKLDQEFYSNHQIIDVLTIESLLNELQEFDPDSVQIIELRFYAGRNLQEISEIMGISTATISRLWAFAKSWLLNRLEE